MYALCYELQSFGMLDARTQLQVVQHFVEAITIANQGYLRHVAAPLLYESGVHYRPDNGRIERQWWDVPAVLAHGYGDCKALCAWRAAELQVMGERAMPRVIQEDSRPGFIQFHVIVARAHSTEDPSVLLGMI